MSPSPIDPAQAVRMYRQMERDSAATPYIMGDVGPGFVGPGQPPSAAAPSSQEDAMRLYRQMERDFTNSQPYTSPEQPVDPYAGYDPEAMAKAEFGPQFDALDAAIKQQQSRYDTSNADLAKMYEALAQSTLARTGDVQSLYDKSGNNMRQNYTNTAEATSKNFTDSANALAEVMQRLGIQQAAPTVFGKSQQELGRLLGDLASRSQNNVDTNTALGRNEIAYLGRTADTNRLAGKNAQSDLLKQFMALQAQNDQRRVELISGQRSAANQYSLNINKMKQNDMATQLDQAKLELEKAKFGQQVSNDEFANALKAQDSQYSTKDPSANLSNRAYEMFNGDATAASTAALGVITAYQRSGGTSLAAMLSEIDSMPTTDVLSRDKYKQLALNFWLGVQGK